MWNITLIKLLKDQIQGKLCKFSHIPMNQVQYSFQTEKQGVFQTLVKQRVMQILKKFSSNFQQTNICQRTTELKPEIPLHYLATDKG